MFHKTITLFNRNGGQWIPTVIDNVQMITDKAVIIRTFGEKSQDNGVAFINYTPSGTDAIISGKMWLPPKKYEALYDKTGCITFRSGENFDFIVFDSFPSDIIPDSLYGIDGFYQYCLKNYDGVYAVTGSVKYDLLPHFEVSVR